jgi:hypothetical protein
LAYRPGRLEVHIEINLPDENGRFQILQIHTNKMKENSFLSPDVNLQELGMCVVPLCATWKADKFSKERECSMQSLVWFYLYSFIEISIKYISFVSQLMCHFRKTEGMLHLLEISTIAAFTASFLHGSS